jgi:exodeoxyribonuclease VII large subunit
MVIKNQRILSVSELTAYLQDKIESDPRLSNLWLRGEVSNVKKPASGHLYFTLKDENTLLKCIIFRSYCTRLQFQLEDGMQVIVRGNLGIYGRSGQYQLYVQEVQLYGTGSLHMAYEQLKNKLSKEGLFDAIYKKKLPFCPKRIGIVTSKSGAVLRDIINVISRRFSGVKLFVVPVAVQGENAPDEIAEGIRLLNKFQKPEVIVVARGGGSIEELWAFNTEKVARAIFDSQIPVISAVGHETDYTIADFVSDLRTPTPSAAAEIIVPSRSELQERVRSLSLRLNGTIISNLKESQERINSSIIRLNNAITNLIIKKENMLSSSVRAFNNLNPLKVLERGYSVCYKEDGRILKDSKDVSLGDNVKVMLAKGSLFCYVDSKEENS